MQQRRGWAAKHPGIAVSRARAHSFEKAKHAAHSLHPVERRYELHLGRTGIHKARIHSTLEQGSQQTFRAVHARLNIDSTSRALDGPSQLLQSACRCFFKSLNKSRLFDVDGRSSRIGASKTFSMQRLVLAYKNFAAHQNISHIGLGVSALNTCKVLRRGGIIADVWPVVNAKDLTGRLQRDPATHVVISAPWIPSVDIHGLVTANSFHTFRRQLPLQRRLPASRFQRRAAGSRGHGSGGRPRTISISPATASSFASGFVPPTRALAPICRTSTIWITTILPWRPLYTGGTLRIGAFGATRPLKNFMSAAGAALEITHRYKANLELWLSAGRTEGGGDTILRSARAMLDGLPNVKLVENGWQSLAQVPPKRGAHASAAAAQLHRIVQHGDGRWRR